MVRLNDSYEYDFYFGDLAETKVRAAELRKNMTHQKGFMATNTKSESQ